MAIIVGAFTTFYALIFCIGVTSNLVILAGYSKKKKKNGTDIFIMGLAVTDFLCSAISILKFRAWIANNAYCKLQFATNVWFASSQMALTLVINIDRYLAVCFPVHRRPTVRRAVITVAFAYLAMFFFFAAPSLIPTHYDDFIKDCMYRSDINWFNQYDKYIGQGFIVVTVSVSLLLYFRIILALRRQSKVRSSLLPNLSSSKAPHRELGTSSANLPRVANAISEVHHDKALSQNSPTKEGGVIRDRGGSFVVQERILHPREFEAEEDGASTISDRGLPKSTDIADGGTEPKQPQTGQQSGSVPDALDGPSGTGPTLLSANKPNTKPSTVNANQLTERRLTLMLGCVTVIYAVSLIPMFVGRYMPIETRRVFMNRSNIHHTIYAIFIRLYEVNSVINVFVYWKLNRRFRKDCQEFLAKIRRTICKCKMH
nr:5-hydroxytryptamine receptor 1A-like [Lytechinus pictus]